jgi:hypothetical protein
MVLTAGVVKIIQLDQVHVTERVIDHRRTVTGARAGPRTISPGNSHRTTPPP